MQKLLHDFSATYLNFTRFFLVLRLLPYIFKIKMIVYAFAVNPRSFLCRLDRNLFIAYKVDFEGLL